MSSLCVNFFSNVFVEIDVYTSTQVLFFIGLISFATPGAIYRAYLACSYTFEPERGNIVVRTARF